MSLGLKCDKGDRFTVLVNSTGGGATVELSCGKDNFLSFTDFDEIDAIVRKNSKVGFAIALTDGQFKAVRFSLEGSSHALDLMRLAAVKLNEQMGKKVKDSQTF